MSDGSCELLVGGISREVLCWYDEQGNRYSTAEERALEAEERVERMLAELDRYRQKFGELPDS